MLTYYWSHLFCSEHRLASCPSTCPSGTFNMDTPWLYIYTAHKLSRLQPHTLQLTSELTASKWLNIHNFLLEGFYRDRGREKEARLKLYTPAITYVQVSNIKRNSFQC